MMASPKYRLKQVPTDIWSIKERLCLASSVLRSGDQNWVSVSRAIRPFGEVNRPPDWFSQKNCAIQYSDLLEKVETPKRKRGDRADVETPGNLIVRKLTIERIEELKRIINEEQQRHRKLKQEVEAVKSGCVDDRLEEVWNKIQEEIKLKAAAEASYQKWLQEREAKITAMKATPKPLGKSKKLFPRQPRVEEVRRNSSQSEQSEQDSILDSPLSEPLSVDYFPQVDDVSSPQSTIPHSEGTSTTISTKMSIPSITVCTSTNVAQTPSTSPLLTSLLKSPTPATPISPTITSVLTSPTPQPKEGTLPTTQTSPRPISTPQTFFNPTSALATAAARQLAVATAPSSSSTSVDSLFMKDKSHSVNQNINSELNIPITHSSTSSAPTLSKLLELPPGVPGKLPPLPVIQTEQTVSRTEQFSTDSTVTVTTVTTIASPAITNVVSLVTSEIVTDSSNEKSESLNLLPSIDDIDKSADRKEDICKTKIDIKVEPTSPVRDKEDIEENEVETGEVVDKEESVEEIKKEVITSEESEQNDISMKNEEVENESLEKQEAQSEKLPEEKVNEDIEKEQTDEISSKVEKEENPVIEEPSLTPTIKEGNEVDILSEPVVFETITNEKQESSEKMTDESIVQDKKQSSVTEEIVTTLEKEENKDVQNKQQGSETEKLVIEDGRKAKPYEEPAKEPLVVVESNKVIEELKIIRKYSGKRGRKGRGGRPSRQIHIHEEVEESSIDKKNDKDKIVSVLPQTDITTKQITNDNQEKQEKSNETQQPSSKLESTNQQAETSTDQVLLETKRKPLLSISESIPNSPASTSQSDDQENIKDYRTWKKAIMLVWNAAANHKYANTFLHPVTDDVAPGYHSIVFRPMDLSAIKKNIENGFIKTTMEFQRDMMLMFQNAVMYNSSDHDVFHMAVEMQKEVMEHIQDFLATQLMVQTADTKVLRGREREPRERKTDGDKDDKRKYSYISEGEPKAKKRRTRE